MKRDLIRWPEVYKLTKLNRATVWRKEANGKFPNKIITGFNEVKWDRAQILEWLKHNNKGGHQGKCTLKERRTK